MSIFTINWPASLPQGFDTLESYPPAKNVVRTPTDAGTFKIRRRLGGGVRPLGGSMTLDAAQWATLQDFFQNTLVDGSLGFCFPRPYVTPTTLLDVAFREEPTPQSDGPLQIVVNLRLWVFPSTP